MRDSTWMFKDRGKPGISTCKSTVKRMATKPFYDPQSRLKFLWNHSRVTENWNISRRVSLLNCTTVINYGNEFRARLIYVHNDFRILGYQVIRLTRGEGKMAGSRIENLSQLDSAILRLDYGFHLRGSCRFVVEDILTRSIWPRGLLNGS